MGASDNASADRSPDYIPEFLRNEPPRRAGRGAVRFLRSDHIAALIPGSHQHLIRRLGRLFHAGLLNRPRHQLRLPDRQGPMVYCLAERSRKELKGPGSPVFPTVPRLRNTADCFRYGRSTMFLFTVADELIASENPLDEPWQNCMGEPAVLMTQPATESPICQSTAPTET